MGIWDYASSNYQKTPAPGRPSSTDLDGTYAEAFEAESIADRCANLLSHDEKLAKVTGKIVKGILYVR